jgi:4'-phosphopantetheinyl transferase
VAVAYGSPVGVDVETVVEVAGAELDLLAGGILAEEERAQLDRCPAGHRAAAFTTYWTRKEAVLKATGDGLATPLKTLVVSPPSCPPRVLRWPPAADPVPDLSMHVLHPPAGHVATLAVLGDAPTRVVEADAGPLLRCAVAR